MPAKMQRFPGGVLAECWDSSGGRSAGSGTNQRDRGLAERLPAEDQFDAADVKFAAVLQFDRGRDLLALHKRAVLASQILESRALCANRQSGVVPRDSPVVDTHCRGGIAAAHILSVAESGLLAVPFHECRDGPQCLRINR